MQPNARRTRSARLIAVCLLAISPWAAEAQIGRPTVADTEAFLAEADAALLASSVAAKRAAWVQSTFITYDTELLSAEASPEEWNASWWRLRGTYQGVASPVARSEADFDPGAKYHVPASTPYMRYFLAHILQFQFHRALCAAAGYEGPLHRCSIYGSEEAGRRLDERLTMGLSRPWPDALEALTGQRTMDATAILDYFAPLADWLDKQNAGRSCGW